MNPSLLRQIWSQVEETQTTVLLQLDDNSLVYLLLNQLQKHHFLSAPEADQVMQYISSKLSLIRDLALSR
ncbi:hypothetical protein [Prochlorothrix hollandica]|uniref:Uncharacterized protein n=1 Tax=Prochlorothrix hollandica PCC 9006 = CALU 1027 TaxID=317619 RepID=A0A0M2Q3J0_PROHO|nr:hypothetical protein [Prochlorothrix hollandica]KKJ01509.1 hypothetical protein PROH_04145 [Prochlorothrix hollandica PCC 9006 = CALU 1027]